MNKQPRHIRQAGFTLVELMVSMVIGLLIVLALITLLINVTRNNSEMAKTNSQIENGRFAMQLIQNDLVHAGFWGGFVPQFDDLTFATVPLDAPSATVPNPCLAYSTPWTAGYKTDIIGIPVQAYGATPPSGTGCVTNFATNKKADTDVLVVRHTETCLPGVGNCEGDTVDRLYFQASLCELENATPYVLNTTGFTLRKRTCAAGFADKRKFISNIYYIRDYAVSVGDGIPTLMRSQFDLKAGTLAHQAAEPMIEGIEGFSVEFGIDNISDSGADITTPYATVPAGITCNNAGDPRFKCSIDWASTTPPKTSPTNRGDGIPDGAFVHCADAAPCTATQLTNVVAVKLHVLARAREASPGYTDSKTYALGSTTLGPFGDRFKRHIFSTTVRLNNIAGRRETP